jgi:Heparan-alpha-glucosaminide N-acetyltransferase, catalytic
MFQTHCYDAWLSPAARKSTFFMYSQLGGTFPAPLFLFLAGISFALVTSKLIKKGLPAGQIARTTILRGAQILGFGLLFRLQEYLIAWGWAPWSDLLRVDILNTIGVSMMLMGILCWLTLTLLPNRPRALPLSSAVTALAIALLTPLLWTTWRPDWLPWPIESYINGVHNLGAPQAWLFPVFPWSAFAFAGLALGFILQSSWSHRHESVFFLAAAPAGIALIQFGRWLDAHTGQVYPVYDFWHTSPNFFVIRLGFLLVILSACYAWCRWGLATLGFSPLIQLGQTSLLVYWVHIELVYGRFSIMHKHAQSITTATYGLLTIILMMLALSLLRTKTKDRVAEWWSSLRTPVRAT